jgi:hypothetical protein
MESSFVNKKAAKENANVEYSKPIVIHNSRQKRTEILPFFIKHTDENSERDLTIKLTDYEKDKVFEHKVAEINLNAQATAKLRNNLNEWSALKKVPDNGNFLLIKLGTGQSVDLSGLNSADVAKAVISILENDDIVANIDAVDFSDDLAFAFRNSIRIKSLIRAMNDLQTALDSNDSEQFYQDWCEDNGWIFGNQYVIRDTERSISRRDKVDFLATSVISGFRDVIELKKPSFSVLNYDPSHESYYFSADVTKAIGQCHRYLDALSEEAANGLRDNREIIAYHPRATIIIGRSDDWDDVRHKGLHGLNCRLNGISVLTYDHLLLQGQRLIDMLQSKNVDVDNSELEDDGELPF